MGGSGGKDKNSAAVSLPRKSSANIGSLCSWHRNIVVWTGLPRGGLFHGSSALASLFSINKEVNKGVAETRVIGMEGVNIQSRLTGRNDYLWLKVLQLK